MLFSSLLRKYKWWLQHKDDIPANTCLPCQKPPQEENTAIAEEKPPKINQQTHENVQDTKEKTPEEKPAENKDESLPDQKDNNRETKKEAAKDGSQNDEKVELTEQAEGAYAVECIKSDNFKLPEFPLFPLSKGFQKSLENCLEQLKNAIVENDLGACLTKNK